MESYIDSSDLGLHGWSMLWAEAGARIIFFARTCESSETVVLTTGSYVWPSVGLEDDC